MCLLIFFVLSTEMDLKQLLDQLEYKTNHLKKRKAIVFNCYKHRSNKSIPTNNDPFVNTLKTWGFREEDIEIATDFRPRLIETKLKTGEFRFTTIQYMLFHYHDIFCHKSHAKIFFVIVLVFQWEKTILTIATYSCAQYFNMEIVKISAIKTLLVLITQTQTNRICNFCLKRDNISTRTTAPV